MRPALSLFIAAVGFTSALAAGQAPPPTSAVPILPGDSSITGRVIERTTERPLEGILVTLTSWDRKRALVTHTDAAGRYEFAHIAAGEYRVTASHPEYVTTEFGSKDVRISVMRETLIALERHVLKNGIDFSLVRGATMTGRVTRHDGQPLNDARVMALLQADDGGLTILASFGAKTNGRGEYALLNLPEGRYHVSALWSEGEPMSARAASPPQSVYHPGTTRAQELVAVPLSAGGAAKNIDIVFPSSELLHISGRIVHSGSAGQVEAFLMTGPAMQPVTVAPDGTFTTAPLRAGRYTLVARGRSDDALEAAFLTVDLSFDTTDLVLGLMATGAISGRVVTDDGTPVSDEMQVAAVLVDDGKELDEYRRDRAEIGPRGEFEVRGVFGQRVMRMVGVTAGWKIARVTVGKNEVTTLSVEPGVTIDDVLIVLTRS